MREAVCTRHSVYSGVFIVGEKGTVGGKGEYHRYFFTTEMYRELIDLQNKGVLCFQWQALVLEGALHYLPVQICCDV